MSIAIHCDCCKRKIRTDMALYVLRLWDLGGFSNYPTVPADGLPFDDEYQLYRLNYEGKRSFELITDDMGCLRPAVRRAFCLGGSVVVIKCDTPEDAKRAAQRLRLEYQYSVPWLMVAQRGDSVCVVGIDDGVTAIRWRNVEG